jgi:ParB family chromosome partitioning protein
MTKSAPRLGKGLSALIGPRAGAPFHHRTAAAQEAATAALRSTTLGASFFRDIPLDQIRPNPRQPRTSLDQTALEHFAESVRHAGILQPVVVRALPDGAYELVAGERRWRAAALAGLKTVPALVRELSDAESFEAALIENLQREDLAPLERATAYQQLIDTLGVTAAAAAARLGESRANVSNYLRILALSDEIKQLIAAGQLGMGQARAVAGIDNPQRQLAAARLAVRRNLSVRQVEALAKRSGLAEAAPRSAPRQGDAHLADVEQALRKALGLTVSLHPGRKKNSGRVIIRYGSLEEFDRLAEKICGRSLME